MENKIEISGRIVFMVLLGAITVVSIAFSNDIFGEASIFNKSVSDIQTLNDLYHSVPMLLKCIQAVFFGWVILKILQFTSTKMLSGSKGGVTASKLINSFLKYIVAIIVLLIILKQFGVNTATLIASAGILSLVVGLGAQSLIADIIAGVFIVFESEFQVGDMVVIDGWRGTVEEIGIRSTRIVDAGGNIKIVNNSSITTVVNQSQQHSVAKSIISIEYGESLQRVELIISENLDEIRRSIPEIINGPYYKGVTELGPSSVDLLFMADCNEEDIYIVQRAMNRELKLMFDRNDVNIPFPQIVLNQPVEFKGSVTPYEDRAADRFTEQQKILSKDMEENVN